MKTNNKENYVAPLSETLELRLEANVLQITSPEPPFGDGGDF